jgi:hypothetical protein
MARLAYEKEVTALLAIAHGVHEKEVGRPYPDWPRWYAKHMTRTLRDAG